MRLVTSTESTTASLEEIREMLAKRFDTGIVIEKTGEELWEWAAKRGSHWGKIVREEPHKFTRPAANVLGFRLITRKAFIVETTTAVEEEETG